MTDSTENNAWLEGMIGTEVVAELGHGFTAFGTLATVDGAHIVLTDVDLHDQAEANSSRDVYAIETAQIGIRANRKRLYIPRSRLICMSPLSDIAG